LEMYFFIESNLQYEVCKHRIMRRFLDGFYFQLEYLLIVCEKDLVRKF
jgi:hypothetical protein